MTDKEKAIREYTAARVELESAKSRFNLADGDEFEIANDELTLAEKKAKYWYKRAKRCADSSTGGAGAS